MSRTRATFLVLMNWKGVFYEQYEIDSNVTALEGTNGAGKTTVMIAAYVALLPDMSRLRFTNVGESGATGGDKGIWGRLGEANRPAYSIIEFAIAGDKRLIAGVHLERKSEPSIEPTPFIITGLDDKVRLQELLLLTQGELELVPEIGELQENAARAGGCMQIMSSARDYFAVLFDYGVTPLRLSADEERNKFNEMLRTSMTGGISRALTSDLRSFLLKEEGGLADTLKRMRANLEACRRTRAEVQESQRLEREIGGVFQAGHLMFAAAFLATRERARERTKLLDEAKAADKAARHRLEEATEQLAQVCERLDTKSKRSQGLKEELRELGVWLKRLERALEVSKKLLACQQELAAAESKLELAADDRALYEVAQTKCSQAVRSCHENLKRATRGLADLQGGVEQLHFRAGKYHRVIRQRSEAERRLGIDNLEIESIENLLGRCRKEFDEVNQARRAAKQHLADADEQRREFAAAHSDLQHLAGEKVEPSRAYVVALEQLRRVRDLALLAEQVDEISTELAKSRKLAKQQADARTRLEALAISLPSLGDASEVIGEYLTQAEQERERCLQAEREASARVAECQRVVERGLSRQGELRERAPVWFDLSKRAMRVAQEFGAAITSRGQLQDARRLLSERWDEAKESRAALIECREGLLSQARELLAAGGPFDAELLRIKDALGAELLASAFEEIPLDAAGPLEAQLGPLVQALVVDDPTKAAVEICDRPSSLSEVWLVGRDEQAPRLAGVRMNAEEGVRDVVVQEALATRVTRIPKRPRLGRKARETRAGQLRTEAEQLDEKIEQARVKEYELTRLSDDGDCLLEGLAVWLDGDPTPELAALADSIAQAEREREELSTLALGHHKAAEKQKVRIAALRELLGMAMLFDPPDHAQRGDRLEKERQKAIDARNELRRCGDIASSVEDKLNVLRRLPLAEADVNLLAEEFERLSLQSQRLDAGIEALEYVSKNREALGWDDAPQELEKNSSLVPALEEQLRRAECALEKAEANKKAADGAMEISISAWQDADGNRRAAVQLLQSVQRGFEELQIADPTPEAIEATKRDLAKLEAESEAIEQALDELKIDKGRHGEELRQAELSCKQSKEKLTIEQRDTQPAVERWDRLQKAVAANNLLPSMSNEKELSSIRGHVNLVQEARKLRAVLEERLRPIHGAQEILTTVGKEDSATDQRFADIYLDLWMGVRDWLRRRLPAQVAEVDDPREALERLREQLIGLEERLSRQEQDLRGASQDIAASINVQVRNAKGQVQRLNKSLNDVCFGDVKKMRVTISSDSRMEKVLRALQDGAVQELLFQESMPLEQALEEIFRRHGSGRRGGQRLLDYREYVHLQTEIRRKTGTEWEVANSNKLSSGEAIGVGASLMIVILTEWERDANLLRGKREQGTLRFLFLDEANRLSMDSLDVLFDLCQSLELQLLIAAPEVARAGGNTTYRLERRVGADGRSEVKVSGRRTRSDL